MSMSNWEKEQSDFRIIPIKDHQEKEAEKKTVFVFSAGVVHPDIQNSVCTLWQDRAFADIKEVMIQKSDHSIHTENNMLKSD